MKNKAFTLIEVLIVILIIGIIAAIAFPQYQAAVVKARIKPVVSLLRSIVNAENLYMLANGEYTINWEELDIHIPNKLVNGEYNHVMLLQEGEVLQLNNAYPAHVFFIGHYVTLYAAFPREMWLCYPRGNSRGKAACKILGCTDADVEEKHACYFNP